MGAKDKGIYLDKIGNTLKKRTTLDNNIGCEMRSSHKQIEEHVVGITGFEENFESITAQVSLRPIPELFSFEIEFICELFTLYAAVIWVDCFRQQV